MADQGMGVVEVYQDAKSEWRWRRKAGNGKIIACSAEGYANLTDAQESMLLACGGLANVRLVQISDTGGAAPDDTPPQDTPSRG